ncbi:hypothetical protein ADIMK_1220 [Marinobacterium lacunae]|uniref:Uncharacterized protein n=1 Tax=Marinobacterium lacunae TaxID=1232683 RepID=A0A081G1W2_9GAMM|nr:hypothetical protein [Marinobacterium lacunae]KEA64767.1 hypothetical protein ADIMK_1220 [Marinobacterium lacunae]MBR9883270.1 hypothetical protein [Oceanospirillales bacterium]
MPSKMKVWSAEQLKQMNEERFLVEMLDMFKYTPEFGESDGAVKEMREHLDRVEKALRTRLEVKKEN